MGMCGQPLCFSHVSTVPLTLWNGINVVVFFVTCLSSGHKRCKHIDISSRYRSSWIVPCWRRFSFCCVLSGTFPSNYGGCVPDQYSLALFWPYGVNKGIHVSLVPVISSKHIGSLVFKCALWCWKMVCSYLSQHLMGHCLSSQRSGHVKATEYRFVLSRWARAINVLVLFEGMPTNMFFGGGSDVLQKGNR